MASLRGAGLEDLLAHSDWLGRLAHRLASPADAQDALQETWMAAQRSPPDPERPARPWLAGVLRNFLRARWQTDRRRRRREEIQAAIVPDREAAVDSVYERVEMQRLVAELVMSLDEPIRIVLLLRYFEGHDSTRIGQILGLPAGTVRWRLKTALDRLRTQMDTRFGDRRTWAVVFAPAAAHAPGPASPARADSPAAPAPATAADTQLSRVSPPGFGRPPTLAVEAPGSVLPLAPLLASFLALLGGAGVGAGLGVWSGGAAPEASNPEVGSTVSAGDPAGPRPGGQPLSQRQRTDRARAELRGARSGTALPRPRFVAPTAGLAAGPATVAPLGVLAGVVRLRGEPEDDVILVANPIATAPVEAAAAPVRARSVEGGFFELAGLAPGRYVVTASGHDEGTARAGAIAVTADAAAPELVIDLQPAEAVLFGRVVDSVAGGISRARVRARAVATSDQPPLVFEAESGCLGRYRLHVPADHYGIEVEADGYAPTRLSLPVPAPLARTFVLHPAIDRLPGEPPAEGPHLEVP